MGDCSLDITMNKIVEAIRSSLSSCAPSDPSHSLRLDEKLHWPNIVDSSMDVMPRSRVFHNGRISSTFAFAEIGELNYHSDVMYTITSDTPADTAVAMDTSVLNTMKEIVRSEVECQVCYALILDPLTSTCGHTYCRRCVARMLDHSSLCPTCRRKLTVTPGVTHEPSNKGLSKVIARLLPEQLEARIAAVTAEDTFNDEDEFPLFPCTLSYPLMPMYLHIFEPRYRLMIRRVLESGTRRFGILAYNSSHQSQGSLGVVPFLQYGTVLQITRVEIFPDGRSLIESIGTHRFKVLEHRMKDGYMVGKVQRIDDIPFSQEEAAEAREVAAENADDNSEKGIDSMSTQALLQLGLDFIHNARQRSAPWLQDRVLSAYGAPLVTAVGFPFWFASVLPIAEEEKYLLLPVTSVRERLKMTARWIKRLETARWQQSASCTIL